MNAKRFGLLVMVAALAALTACGGPRETPMTRAQAMAATTPRVFKVIKVYDRVEDAIQAPDHDLGVSHYIEVDPLDGIGGRLLLPFDTWNTGKVPPEAGARVVLAPADWVRRDPTSAGRPPE